MLSILAIPNNENLSQQMFFDFFLLFHLNVLSTSKMPETVLKTPTHLN